MSTLLENVSHLCLSDIFYSWIEVMHLWQEYHRSDIVSFSVHNIGGCNPQYDVNITGSVNFDQLG